MSKYTTHVTTTVKLKGLEADSLLEAQHGAIKIVEQILTIHPDMSIKFLNVGATSKEKEREEE